MSIEELAQATYNNHHQSVVSVLGRSSVYSLGSGFIIKSTATSCLVMTCQHVIAYHNPFNTNHSLCVRLAGETTEYPAVILHASEFFDLAILQAHKMPREYPTLQFGDAQDVPASAPVFLLAYNRPAELKGIQPVLNLFPSVCPGNTSAPAVAQLGGAEGVMDLTYTLASKKGTSGGAVISGGRVRGVHYKANWLQHACSAETVNYVLGLWLGIPKDVTPSTEEMLGRTNLNI